MGDKIVVGPINKGLRTDREPFVIDNDSFPVLINAYQWRGRVKRKRGTSLLGRLQRFFGALQGANIGDGIATTITTNIFTLTGIILTQPNASVVPNTFKIQVGNPSIAVFEDLLGTGILTGTFGTAVSGTINYANGDITLVFSVAPASSPTFIDMNYYPGLPVMGLETLSLIPTDFPGLLAFDTRYSYSVTTTTPISIYDVSYYKNPSADGTNLPGYIPKAVWTPTTWNGQDYQQFWTTNYQGALWATNGIDVPFTGANIGMQFSGVTNVAAPIGNTVVITVTGPNLVVGDFVFLNEFDPAIITGINQQSGYVIAGSAPGAITIELPFATLAGPGGATTKGIVQYLTNRSDGTKDCIRWYDGDPTNGNPTNPGFTQGKGWVNFMPPLSQDLFSIADLPRRIYYLVGARIILQFKDRLLFMGPVVQASGASDLPIYLQDTVIYSQNGTPYYTSSFTYDTAAPNDATLASIVFHPILVPTNQTATATAYFEDSFGFGGFITAGLDQALITAASNEDVLIIGFETIQTRLAYTGNDLIPFNFFQINSELGSASTFSAINTDEGVLSQGSRGYVITGQTQAQRIDLAIPDQVFEINLRQNGNERFCAQRDFINEWIYFTYPVNTVNYDAPTNYKFPNKTLQFNYRDNSWAVFNESYTTYGSFKLKTGNTWNNIGDTYPSWDDWNTPWNSGASTLLDPKVIAGNQQGFILFRDQGTGEAPSLFIQSFTGNIVTSANHNLDSGDYIIISGVLGTVGTQVNGKIFSVFNVTNDTFQLDPIISSGTYIGGGLIKRIYLPFIQTKQFPVAWEMARKTRLGVQQYLLSKTDNAQITLQIYLSQDASNPYNFGEIVPSLNTVNSSLIYSTVLFTCPESANLGLTPANTNLQMVTANTQAQIWHRINTSLLGDTIQLGFTLSDAQMRAVEETGEPISQFAEIEIHGFILDVTPSMLLS